MRSSSRFLPRTSRPAQAGVSVVLILVVLALIAGGAWWWFKPGAQAEELAFNSTQVARGDVVQTVTATGDLQPVTTVDVSSQISGLLTAVLVDYNDKVTAGDVLARIDPATYESRLASARADLANVEANYRLVKLNSDRTHSLFDRKLVTQQEVDQAEAQLAQANAQLLTRQAAVANAETDLARCTLYAPIDGVVIDRIAEVGKTVAASLNAPTLFTIVNDLAKMEINAYVSEADIGSVAEGQAVTFTVDAYPNRNFRGKVTQIRNSPLKEQSVIVYSTIIDVDNSDLKLKPGMTANVAIITAERRNVLRVPNSALRVRLPEGVTVIQPPATPAAPTGAVAEAAPADPREQFRDLMREAGWSGEGRPTPEIMQKARALAEQRGIQLPQRGEGGGRDSGGGGRSSRQAPDDNRPTKRTVYLRVADAAKPTVQAVNAMFGISDGSSTELISGIDEGADLITGLALSGATTASASSGTSNPFASQPRFGRP